MSSTGMGPGSNGTDAGNGTELVAQDLPGSGTDPARDDADDGPVRQRCVARAARTGRQCAVYAMSGSDRCFQHTMFGTTDDAYARPVPMRCRHRMRSGRRCRKHAMRGKVYCRCHLPEEGVVRRDTARFDAEVRAAEDALALAEDTLLRLVRAHVLETRNRELAWAVAQVDAARQRLARLSRKAESVGTSGKGGTINGKRVQS